MATIAANTSNPTVTISETTSKSFTLTVTPPSFPEGVTKWDSVDLSITATKSGSRNAYVKINNGTQYTVNSGSTITITQNLGTNVTSRPTSYSGTCTGNHKQAAGSVTFSNGVITYTYTSPSAEQMMIKVSGAWQEVTTVYKKVSGVWVEQTELADVFSTTANYKKES